MGTYEQYNKDPILDAMISSVLDRKDAKDPFTGLDLANTVADTVKNFGVYNFEDHPQDGLIDEAFWAFRIKTMFTADPAKTLDELASFLTHKGAPRTKRSHRVLFLDCLVHHPHMTTVLPALRADTRFNDLDLR